MNTCARCHATVSVGAEGRPLPHRLSSGAMCGGLVDRIGRAFAPERTTSPLARFFDRQNQIVSDVIQATHPSVFRFIPPLDQILESAEGTNLIRTFYRVGVETIEGETYCRYTERAPGEAPPTGEPLEGSIGVRTGDNVAIDPSDLIRTATAFLRGRRD